MEAKLASKGCQAKQLAESVPDASAARVEGLAAQSEPAQILLTKKNGLYYVQVAINSNSALLLADTGASITLLNRKFSGLTAGVPRERCAELAL